MVNKLTLKIIILLPLFSMACATSSKSSTQTTRQPLALTKIEQLKPGVTTKEEAESLLGAAYEKPNIPELQADNKEGWRYTNVNDMSTRLSLIFDRPSGKLDSINWFVDESEPEANLKFTKSKFKTAHFKKVNAKWITPDAAPEHVFWVDSKMGLQIAYSTFTNKVDSITWSKPLDNKRVNIPLTSN